jgi:hypothetical protein
MFRQLAVLVCRQALVLVRPDCGMPLSLRKQADRRAHKRRLLFLQLKHPHKAGG